MTHSELTDQVKRWVSEGKTIIPMFLWEEEGKIEKKPKGKGWQCTRLDQCEDNFKFSLRASYQPSNGIGLLTGKSNNLTVVDFDSYKDDPKFNYEVFEQLFEGTTYTVNTINGGLQYYFTYTKDLKQSNIKNKIIDIRNDGGVVGTAPSRYGEKAYNVKHELPIKEITDSQLKFVKEYLSPPKVEIKPIQFNGNTELVEKLLCCLLSPRDNYTTWRPIITAVKDTLGEEGYQAALKYTQSSPMFKTDDWFGYQWKKIDNGKFRQFNLGWLKIQASNSNRELYYTTVSNDRYHLKRLIDLASESVTPIITALKYFNQYHYKILEGSAQYAIVTEDVVTIITKRDLIDRYENSNIWVTNDQGKSVMKNVAKEWLKWEDMNTLSGVTFLPNFKKPSLIVDDKINLFRHGIHIYDENFLVDEQLISPWIDHIRDIWASGNEKIYNFIIDRFSIILQRPTFRVPVNIVVRGEMGNGKSCVPDFLGSKVLGNKYYCYFDNMFSFLSDFNSEQEQVMLTCLDEINSGGEAYKKSDQLKSMTSRSWKTINHKYGSRYTVPDYNNMIFLTNNTAILKIEQGDRRYMMLDSSNKRVGDDEYFNELFKYDNITVGCHLFHYLMRRDISNFSWQKIPSTDWKKFSMINNIKPVAFCLLSYLHDNKETETPDPLSTSILWDTFCEKYGNKLPNYTRKKFICEVSSFLSMTADSKNKIDGRYYDISYDQIREVLSKTSRVSLADIDEWVEEFYDIKDTAGTNHIRDCRL